MKSSVCKRSIVVAGHKTSVSLEDAFWRALNEIARSRQMTPSELVTSIDVGRRRGNLSSCLRLFVLEVFHNQSRSGGAALQSTKRTGNSRLPSSRSRIAQKQERRIARRHRQRRG
jgi:predicted DNA-binding ribbon-helix-helix protein